MKRVIYISFGFFLCGIFIFSGRAIGKSEMTTYSLQLRSFAPNAGGQEAYALRRGTNDSEISIFANYYLYAGNYPLFGGIYSLRFPILDDKWFWQLFVQIGIGCSTAGPMVEVSWGTIPFWVVRVDITTQMIVTQRRMIIWNYPIWAGISIPVP